MSLHGRLFAALYDRVGAAGERELRPRRAALLAGLHGRVVELGAGTGANVELYPPDIDELLLTEPEEPMARRLERRLEAAGVGAQVLRAAAEELPLPDASVDAVVATLVLCTVRDQDRALAEVRRVLVPGGRLVLLEHVRSPDPAVARRQDRWTPLQAWLALGCHPNRDTVAAVERAGLRLERLERFELPQAPEWLRSAVSGVAVAP